MRTGNKITGVGVGALDYLIANEAGVDCGCGYISGSSTVTLKENAMKLPNSVRAGLFAIGLTLVCGSSAARAADGKTYQVTGPVVEVTDASITVMKGKEKWQIARDKDTKVSGGDLKVGSKVTIEYTMAAKTVEVKGEAKADKGAAKADKAAK